ncbi:hypothetical protein C8R47DRAFT_99412 [Mycena vitilis]|nr:hypothetical protein C8R47DRAFT_99412 [Mycena vitilis]
MPSGQAQCAFARPRQLKTPSIPQDDNDKEDEIHIIALNALRAHWTPTSTHRQFRLTLASQSRETEHDLHPHEAQEVARIQLHVCRRQSLAGRRISPVGSRLRPGYVGALVGYQLSFGRDGDLPRWCCLGLVNPLRPAHYQSQIPYSGHILLWPGSSTFNISPTRSSTEHATVDLPHSGECIDVSRYSGALAYSTHESIVVTYFK